MPCLLPLVLFCSLAAYPYDPQTPLTLKGLRLGMNREAVAHAYAALRDAHPAQHVSIENEAYRDLITIENELGSMGDKVELSYDQSGVVTGITFQHTAVDILFDAGNVDAETFVRRFCQENGLPEMERKEQGFLTLWTYVNEEAGYRVSIDDGKNVRIETLTPDGS